MYLALSLKVSAMLEMRKETACGPLVFPAPTKSGHVEPSTVDKQHALETATDAKGGRRGGKLNLAARFCKGWNHCN
jgi:hypothetical protein